MRVTKPIARCAAIAATVGALAVATATPAGAQESLGFEIDSTEGSPGDVVNGQVNIDDVAASCNNDAEELLARFEATHAVLQEMFLEGSVFYPDGFLNDPVVETFEQASLVAATATAGGIDLSLAEEALPQTFIMTFADIATQEPVGDMGNFDPLTGEGSVAVPEVDPGQWAVAAACVSPSTDVAVLEDAVRANAPLVEEWLTGGGFEDFSGVPFPGLPITDPQVVGIIGIGAAFTIGETLVPALMVPDALGAQLFCVLDADGVCPDEEPPPEPPIDGLRPPTGPPTAPTAPPVVAQPAFTG